MPYPSPSPAQPRHCRAARRIHEFKLPRLPHTATQAILCTPVLGPSSPRPSPGPSCPSPHTPPCSPHLTHSPGLTTSTVSVQSGKSHHSIPADLFRTHGSPELYVPEPLLGDRTLPTNTFPSEPLRYTCPCRQAWTRYMQLYVVIYRGGCIHTLSEAHCKSRNTPVARAASLLALSLTCWISSHTEIGSTIHRVNQPYIRCISHSSYGIPCIRCNQANMISAEDLHGRRERIRVFYAYAAMHRDSSCNTVVSIHHAIFSMFHYP